MNIDWATIASELEQGLGLLSQIAPAAAIGGPAAAAIGLLVGKAAGFASTALQAATGAEAVISATDLASIQKSADALQALNDQLAATIAAS
jgi:hypothetical protein